MCKIQTTEDQALLVIKDAERKDTGPYTVTLRNEAGTVEATVKVTVLGKINICTFCRKLSNTAFVMTSI